MAERIELEDSSGFLVLEDDSGYLLLDYAAIRLIASPNISASAATSTTQRLTGLTGTFTAGRISDDTNPLPSVDVGADGNREDEWSLALAYDAPAANQYEFRVTLAGTPLDTYSQTPVITVNGVAPGVGIPRPQSLLQRIPALRRF